MKQTPLNVAKQFKFEGEIADVKPFGNGLINDTFLVETTQKNLSYILQRKNKTIFQDIPAMMDNIYKVTNHLKKKIEKVGGDPMREALTVTPTLDGKLYYKDADGEYWAACYCIPDTVTHHRADSLYLAEQGGAGIGQFQAMLSDMNEPLADILPGFHNMKFRFKQWDAILAKDPKNRKATMQKEIAWIEERREEMIAFWDKVEKGIIPMRVTHNDTKISNMLFDKDNNVLCVIDLDTVLNSTCLNDYGDAIRSYTNNGMEDDKDLDKVFVNMDIFEAYTKGYLAQAKQFLTKEELENVAFSAKYITFEQVLRFLMDYIDGDNYYKINYPEHNLVRTHAQMKLMTSIEENYTTMQTIVNKYSK